MGELLGMLLEGKPTTWQNRNKPQKKQSDKLKRGDWFAVLSSRIGTPMLRATTSTQADLGRWVHVLLQVRPEECLHIINLYGWVEDELAARQVLLEVTERTAELMGSHVLAGGDWNIEPEEFPLDLLQGAGLHRPLARPGATAPQGTRRLDWFIGSASLLPSLGWEEVLDCKPDHAGVAIEIILRLTRS
eukprot:944228-Amphidinium_carterae.1